MKAAHYACSVVVLAVLAVALPARAQTGEGFDLTWSTIDGGGGIVAGSGFDLSSGVGTYDAGRSAGSGYELEGGFLTVAGVEGGGGCVGDCNTDVQVTVDELVTMVNIALGNSGIAQCPAGDSSGDGLVTVDEILTAVNNALNGCA
jgi:hypothetical protein